MTTETGLFLAVGALPAVPLDVDGAWQVESYHEHYVPPPLIGEDRPIDGVPGRLPLPDEIDEAVVGLPMVVYGFKDSAGVAHADALVGVRANLLYLRTNLWLPPGTADGTRPYEFHRLDGEVEAGDVKVSVGTIGRIGPTAVRYTLRVTIPAALLTVVP